MRLWVLVLVLLLVLAVAQDRGGARTTVQAAGASGEKLTSGLPYVPGAPDVPGVPDVSGGEIEIEKTVELYLLCIQATFTNTLISETSFTDNLIKCGKLNSFILNQSSTDQSH